MGKFDAYLINLRNIAPGNICEYEYLLDNKFFINIDGTEVQKGKVNVSLKLEHKNSSFEMNFHITGIASVPCDRCLDDMEIQIETNNRLIIKFGKEYAEESDEILVIAEDEGAINLAWFLYEFVALAIPMKHVHVSGRCNKTMSSKLRKHAPKQSEDDDEVDLFEEDDEMSATDDSGPSETDPRWDALKDLM